MSSDEDVQPFASRGTRIEYDNSTEVPDTKKCSDANGDYIIKAHRDGELRPTYKRISLDASSSSEEATTHTDMSSSTSAWEQLANERGVEIKQLEYHIAVMQKVIRQYDRKCDKIKRIAEAALSRNEDLDELGEAYMERGIGHEEIHSDNDDHKQENQCTYMKHA